MQIDDKGIAPDPCTLGSHWPPSAGRQAAALVKVCSCSNPKNKTAACFSHFSCSRTFFWTFFAIIHPASRGVAAHTAGLFRSVRGAKGGVEYEEQSSTGELTYGRPGPRFPPPGSFQWVLLSLFPPVEASQAREFSLFPPVGASQAMEFSLFPAVTASQAMEFSLFPPLEALQAAEFQIARQRRLDSPPNPVFFECVSMFLQWFPSKHGTLHFCRHKTGRKHHVRQCFQLGLPKLSNFHFSPP